MAKKTKYSAIDELSHMETELSNADGNIDITFIESNIEEIVNNFKSYSEVIRDMARQTLTVINHYLHEGYTEQEIVDEFNKHFTEECKYKNIKELITHYQTIGI